LNYLAAVGEMSSKEYLYKVISHTAHINPMYKIMKEGAISET